MIIKNINEAIEANAAVGIFLEKISQTLGTLGSMSGNIAGIALNQPVKQDPSTPTKFAFPETMQDRVIAILVESGLPMKPKAMVERYNALGWPIPPKGNVYSAILACAYYMAKNGKLQSAGGRYGLPEKQSKLI